MQILHLGGVIIKVLGIIGVVEIFSSTNNRNKNSGKSRDINNNTTSSPNRKNNKKFCAVRLAGQASHPGAFSVGQVLYKGRQPELPWVCCGPCPL